jgi:hypothetical protein
MGRVSEDENMMQFEGSFGKFIQQKTVISVDCNTVHQGQWEKSESLLKKKKIN